MTIDNSPAAQAIRLARGMSNQVLATALDGSRYSGEERKAIIFEAARRLRWRDAYEASES